MAIPCQKRLGLPLISSHHFRQRLPNKWVSPVEICTCAAMPGWSSHLSLPPLLLFPPHLGRSLQMKKSQEQFFAFFLFCKRNFHFLFPIPYFLLNPHGFSWVVDILRVDGSLLVSVLLLLLGVVHHHVVLEDEAEVDWLVVRPGERRGTV